MAAILKKIIESKKQEVALLPKISMYQSEKRQVSGKSSASRNFIRSILDADAKQKMAIIAEIKPKSPSSGELFDIKNEKNLRALVHTYDKSASAISVLCDTPFFGGGYELLKKIRDLSKKPILAKEFMIDIRQIYKAHSCGADAILLIAAILTPKKIVEFTEIATQLEMAILIEVHTLPEVKKIISVLKKIPASIQKNIIIGINNRNLDTLKINLATTEKLAPIIKKSLPDVAGIISESGIETENDTTRLAPYIQGFLIGTSILKSKKPDIFLRTLTTQSSPKIKFCGLTRKEDIIAAEKYNADYIGFIFVPSSPRHITLEQAKKLIPCISRAKKVGVFENISLLDLKKYIHELELDFVQLHAAPDTTLAKKIHTPIIQAFRGIPSEKIIKKFLKVCPYILIDKEKNANEADFKKIAKLPREIRDRLFLAGGLTPENVQKAIDLIHPYAVDCARGIEKKPGKKDVELMKTFARNARHINV